MTTTSDQTDHYVLVVPDRDAAEELSARLTAAHPTLPEPELHREALAGEDDAEDAQWLVVLDPPLPITLSVADLHDLAAEFDGWLEDF
ncbi:hypothetical protein [Streptacidiphilus jiangxiensis]|uniref:Uncharacterized protein n=1 Tax=Streptacidiphilus jiangxiensis TaxID=235985 RepID=A0A1H7S8E9_STRJI|nr:hypothetical protein [Streptacidiphilus jiangxiensis]SEL68668.1 hypothetical protein SAMN05414137_111214 [Streptacidiphilus jiangxiensis]